MASSKFFQPANRDRIAKLPLKNDGKGGKSLQIFSVSFNRLTLGRQDADTRKRIGAVFQYGLPDDLLTVEEDLRMRTGFYGMRGSASRADLNHAVSAAGASRVDM